MNLDTWTGQGTLAIWLVQTLVSIILQDIKVKHAVLKAKNLAAPPPPEEGFWQSLSQALGLVWFVVSLCVGLQIGWKPALKTAVIPWCVGAPLRASAK